MPSPNAMRRACACAAPSVFQISQVEPEERIAEHERCAGQQGEGAQPVEPAAGVAHLHDPDTLQNRAQGDSLGEGRDRRAHA